MCYTQDKLDNKINNLTNKNKNKKEQKMTQTIKLPTKVYKANWKDDVDSDVDFETYGTPKQEMEYIAPDEVTKETINRIKNSPIKLSIDGLWRMGETKRKKVAA